MKFSDIKQFPRSNYYINVPWSHINNWLEDQGSYFKLELEPDFQRGYVWSTYQKESYLEYILRGGVSGKDIYWNCKGWDNAVKNSPLQIVDGKQRLNAVQEFLSDKVMVFGHYYSEFEDKLSLIQHNFNVHVNSLQSDQEIVEWYISMNVGGSVHTPEDLKPAYEFLKTISYNFVLIKKMTQLKEGLVITNDFSTFHKIQRMANTGVLTDELLIIEYHNIINEYYYVNK